MGIYINPGNEGFSVIRTGEYVDKTGLISVINRVIGTSSRLVCVSRPRRFGKSYAAEMLSSYYSCGCASRELFQDLAISQDHSFTTHLNAYNVIRLDMTDILAQGKGVEATLTNLLLAELQAEFPELRVPDTLTLALLAAVEHTGRKFVFVIDEWDAPIRERDEQCTRAYVEFLRSLFKNLSFTARGVAACYLTGILPIKRYNTQSAMSEFDEFTMLDPQAYAPFVGFTEDEVRELCTRHGMSFDEARRWYDGYELSDDTGTAWQIYAPFSVMRAMQRHRFASYWTSTAAYDSLLTYIDMDFDGLQEHVSHLIAGESIPVNTLTFGNDMREVNSADDAFTLLTHLGYLAYNDESATVRIPNEEIRREFVSTLRRGTHRYTRQMIAAADQLLADTLAGNEDAVAAGVQAAHDSRLGPDWYNDEQALRFAVKLAYLTAPDRFAEIEELPSGHGRADIVYVPKRGRREAALVVELKWDRNPGTALDQIRNRNYPKALEGFGGPLLLVGITYDAKTKAHRCKIERMWVG